MLSLLLNLLCYINILTQVKTVIFEDHDCRVDIKQWDAIFPAMKNLTHLVLPPSTFLMSPDILPLIKCRLQYFQALSSVEGVWLDFLSKMHTLEVFLLHESLHGRVLAPLPRLHAIKALAADLAKFAEVHIALCHLWFDRSKPLAERQLGSVELTLFAGSSSRLDTIRISAPNLLLLISGAPEFVSMLSHIVVDEDLTWSDFTLNGGPSLVCYRHMFPRRR
jgi:hypothetical protein